MSGNITEIGVGELSDWNGQSTRLGQCEEIDGIEYVVVEAAATYTTSSAGQAMTTARDSDNKPTWKVSRVTAANSPDVAGIVPETLTDNITTGDRFLLQRSSVVGGATVTSATDGLAMVTDTAFGLNTVSSDQTNSGAHVVARAVSAVDSGTADVEVFPSGLVPISVP